jgi:hypothetical protein
MKKSILVVAALFSFAVMFTSCKETKKEEVNIETEEVQTPAAEEVVVVEDVYQCPMDCEKGKTYADAGSCPVCKMDLKANAGAGEMNHTASCTCKSGGECTCEGGKCQCQSETACTNCKPGNCVCKAQGMSTEKPKANCGDKKQCCNKA